jgi:hypothetical protein
MFGLRLPGSPDLPPLPINWRQVEDEAESACSQVVAVERLLHGMLISVHQNILRLIRVSLKREKIPPVFLWLPPRSFIPHVF